jgi:hypothetical protein
LFLAAEHETVTDTLTLIVPPELNEEQRKNVATLQEQLEAATLRSRMKRFGDAGSTAARATSNYAEVQSELGLAGNAAFVVGRRELTRGVPLNGRAFLQSYDNSADSDDGTLTAILSGPAVVTSWINLQYYASTVAPDVFGAGRKTLHNLVGQFGVIEGGHGDLAIGLSRESLITPTGSAHAPLRLHLMVETSIERLVRCIQRVESIRSLAANEWIRVSALESSHGLTKRTLLSPVLFEKGCASSIAAE